jgi:hypothetical protein
MEGLRRCQVDFQVDFQLAKGGILRPSTSSASPDACAKAVAYADRGKAGMTWAAAFSPARRNGSRSRR